jgi:hypothetical protein
MVIFSLNGRVALPVVWLVYALHKRKRSEDNGKIMEINMERIQTVNTHGEM